MSYAGGRLIHDADSHLMELPDFLTAYADPADRHLMPTLGALATGQFNPGDHVGRPGHDPATVERLLQLGDQITRGPKWHDALGSFSGQERGLALDQLGFARQVVFSSFCARLIFEAALDVRYAVARSHNRAVATFCEGDRRLIGVAIVPLDDPEMAMAEIGHATSLGLGAIWVAAAPPGGRSPGHVQHEPIWATLAERRLPFILHVGSSPLSVDAPWMNDGRPDRRSARGGAEVIGSKDLTVIHHAAQKFISDPRARRRAGAPPRPARRGDRVGRRLGSGHDPSAGPRGRDLGAERAASGRDDAAGPQQQIREQLRFTPYPFEDVAAFIAESAPELYLFSSDYPHAEGGRDPIGRFDRTLADADEAAKTRFYAGNFRDLYPHAFA